MKRDTFVFYARWAEAIKVLPDDERLATLEAIISYAITGAMPDNIPPTAQAIVDLIKHDINYDSTKKEVMREQRRQAGMKGMASRWGSYTNSDGLLKDANQ